MAKKFAVKRLLDLNNQWFNSHHILITRHLHHDLLRSRWSSIHRPFITHLLSQRLPIRPFIPRPRPLTTHRLLLHRGQFTLRLHPLTIRQLRLHRDRFTLRLHPFTIHRLLLHRLRLFTSHLWLNHHLLRQLRQRKSGIITIIDYSLNLWYLEKNKKFKFWFDDGW